MNDFCGFPIHRFGGTVLPALGILGTHASGLRPVNPYAIGPKQDDPARGPR